MLTREQLKFRDRFLSPVIQRFYYCKSLPMGLITGIRLVRLDEEQSVTEVPFRWINKNPFRSIYFAVQCMAAELSTAAPVIMALRAVDADAAFIIVEMKVDFVKKAQSKVVFTCLDYEVINKAVAKLKHPGDTTTVTARSIGRDVEGDEVATFYFTWSFKARS